MKDDSSTTVVVVIFFIVLVANILYTFFIHQEILALRAIVDTKPKVTEKIIYHVYPKKQKFGFIPPPVFEE